mmetsp:Transcript_3316/g.10948  ORF Transcript_3316/g.10948 Transcript_3316/m.10948 type:complete len:140 (-) Transcript_3316:577-996(-)
MASIQERLGALPLVTAGVLYTCVGVYAVGLLTGFDAYGKVCLSPVRILHDWQVWRFVTSALVHGGILHIAFNMMAFVSIGQSLERQLGSVTFMHAEPPAPPWPPRLDPAPPRRPSIPYTRPLPCNSLSRSPCALPPLSA